MTVPFRAIKQGRIGVGCELNPAYFSDGCHYCQMAEQEMSVPTLFDLAEFDNKPDELDVDIVPPELVEEKV